MYIKRITNQLPVQKRREAIEYKTKHKLHSNTCGYIMKIKKKNSLQGYQSIKYTYKIL